MRKHNFGVIKNQVFGSLVESFAKGDSSLNLKSLQFTDTVKNSQFLKLENAFYKYLETKCIKDESSAARYIDECVSLFNKYTKNDYVIEHAKLTSFVSESKVQIGNYDLYNHIDTLLYESLSFTNEYSTNIDALHESYEFILNFIRTNQPKEQIKESKFDKIKSYFTKEEILKKSIENFNDKYGRLEESEKYIVSTITKGSFEEKFSLFEGLKDENSKLLMKQLASSTNEMIAEKLKKSIDKINQMSFNEKSVNKDILNLYSLKSSMKN